MATITEIIRGWNLNKQMGAQLLRVGPISLQGCHLINHNHLAPYTLQHGNHKGDNPIQPSQSATAVGHSRPGQASKLELDPEH
jgi:hypothetical protein